MANTNVINFPIRKPLEKVAVYHCGCMTELFYITVDGRVVCSSCMKRVKNCTVHQTEPQENEDVTENGLSPEQEAEKTN